MNLPSLFSASDTFLSGRAKQLAQEQRALQFQRTDRMFARLLAFEFVAGIATSLWISPFAWSGPDRQLHPHVWSATLLGALIVSLPIWLALVHPGRRLTRHVIAIAQLLMSGLLIHLTQGRIETHFHVFGSLAFLAFYRDWRVLVTASAVTAVDHLVRGYVWPLSIYGVELQSHWRWLEHAGWVIFEDIFLIIACLQGNRETNAIAERQSQLEATNAGIEREVRQRTGELATANAQLAGVLDAATQVSIIATDVDGLITVFNTGAETLLGYSADEMIGKQTPQIIHLRDEVLTRGRELSGELGYSVEGFEVFVAYARQGRFDRHEWTYIRKDGSHFTVSLVVTAVKNAAGEIAGFLGVAEDISLSKRNEEELYRAKEAADAANKSKSSFLANMSHEIRTPMNGIIGMTQLLARTELRSHQRDYLTTIDESAHILLRLLNDILDFSKIEAGKLELETVDFRLSECAGRATQMLVLRAAEKGLEVACRVAPGIPDHLRGDPGRLQQVLVNLLSNAVKFTEAGEIFVNVNAESLGSDRVRLRFSVSDTGIGIPADKHDQIFHPFEQAESSTTRRFGGTGLGLAITGQLVEMMRGRVWLESEVGRGSTFHFTAEFGVSVAGPSHTPAELDSLRELPVLVVDDNFTNRRILGELLQHWRMRPVLTDSAQAARDALRRSHESRQPIRLILLDHHMPGEDGFQFADSVRELLRGDSCTIIMISSGSSPIDVDLGPQHGIARFMTKPVIASELLDEVLRQFGTTAAAQPEQPVPAVTAKETAVAPRHVLLVEDNEINRRVAVGLLRSRGHQVEFAENGQQAVDVLAHQEFDVVLMDMQMPVLDGYEATAAIRQREHTTGGHIPIVAMTAEALKGDRERCLAAGMDDYISKPISPAALHRAVERFPALCLADGSPIDSQTAATEKRASEAHAEPPSEVPPTTTTVPAVDWNVAAIHLSGGRAVLLEFSELARTQTPKLMSEIRTAIASRDFQLLRRSAHSLKGTALHFGAEPLIQAAQALENHGRNESSDGVPQLLAALESEAHRMLAALELGPPDSMT